MSDTRRSARFMDDGRVRETTQPESESRWRADRDERLRRASRDAKRIQRSERHTARLETEADWCLGSTVRRVA